jgi:metal-responsive CopG/Arc/MetJ family transcriptional regulator
MRTTVEITDRQRAKLLELAAERGTKGFSELVQEAIDAYLDSNAARRERVAAALAVLGSLSEREARDLETSVASVRGRWRAE